jgi:hypothetical protein
LFYTKKVASWREVVVYVGSRGWWGGKWLLVWFEEEAVQKETKATKAVESEGEEANGFFLRAVIISESREAGWFVH